MVLVSASIVIAFYSKRNFFIFPLVSIVAIVDLVFLPIPFSLCLSVNSYTVVCFHFYFPISRNMFRFVELTGTLYIPLVSYPNSQSTKHCMHHLNILCIRFVAVFLSYKLKNLCNNSRTFHEYGFLLITNAKIQSLVDVVTNMSFPCGSLLLVFHPNNDNLSS